MVFVVTLYASAFKYEEENKQIPSTPTINCTAIVFFKPLKCARKKCFRQNNIETTSKVLMRKEMKTKARFIDFSITDI